MPCLLFSVCGSLLQAFEAAPASVLYHLRTLPAAPASLRQPFKAQRAVRALCAGTACSCARAALSLKPWVDEAWSCFSLCVALLDARAPFLGPSRKKKRRKHPHAGFGWASGVELMNELVNEFETAVLVRMVKRSL